MFYCKSIKVHFKFLILILGSQLHASEYKNIIYIEYYESFIQGKEVNFFRNEDITCFSTGENVDLQRLIRKFTLKFGEGSYEDFEIIKIDRLYEECIVIKGNKI
jgi:hypothetical protein